MRMPGIWTRTVLAALLGVIFLPEFSHSQETHSPGFVYGEILVGFKEGVEEAQADRVHHDIGSRKKKGFKNLPLHHVEIPAGLSIEEALLLYQEDPAVEFAEPNYIRRAFAIPNDTRFGDQWGLNNTGQTIALSPSKDLIGLADADIDAPEAWDLINFAALGVDIVIALADTGVDFNHTDLDDNLWTNPVELVGDSNLDGCPGVCGVDDDGDGLVDEDFNGNEQGGPGFNPAFIDDDDENGLIDDIRGWNFVAGLNCNSACVCSWGAPAENNDPTDDSGHGTGVAGIAAAEGDNNEGVSGVLWDAQIMPLKVLEKNGCGSISAEIGAIDYAIFQLERMQAVTPTRMVMNASFGGLGFSQAEENAIRRAREAGIVFVAAAGNEMSDNDKLPVFPASHKLSNVISVTATNALDGLAFFGNRGKNNVDLAAPGDFVLTTATGTSCKSGFPPLPFTGYCFTQGTSFSAPFVSGAAGLLFAQNPGLSPEEVRTILILTADPLESLKGEVGSSGRLNLYNALTRKEGSGLTGGDGGCGFPLRLSGPGGGPPVSPGSAGLLMVSLLWPFILPFVRRLRRLRTGWNFPLILAAAAVLLLSLGRSPAHAQFSLIGPDAGSENHSLKIKEGIHRFADSEFFETNGGLISRNDLAGLVFEAEYEFRGRDLAGITGTIGSYTTRADLITVCCTDFSLSTVYLLYGVNFYPYFSFIRPAEWYVGGGLGLYYYRQELKGFLNDRISGMTVGIHGLTGFRVPFGKSLSGFAELRYAWAKIGSADAFDSELDIGGINYLFGLSWDF